MADPERLTRNQSLVLDRLSAAEAPLSAYAILDQVRDEGIKAPLQVYRALDKLVAEGLAHRLESMNAFVACAQPHAHRSGLIVFAICEVCGRVTEFTDAEIKERLSQWSADNGFMPHRTVVEIRGVCAACQKAGSA